MKTFLIISAISIIMLFSQCDYIYGPEPCYYIVDDPEDEYLANYFPYIKYDTIYFKCLNESDSLIYLTCTKFEEGWVNDTDDGGAAILYDCVDEREYYRYYKQHYLLQSDYNEMTTRIKKHSNVYGFYYSVYAPLYLFIVNHENKNEVVNYYDSLNINKHWFYNVYEYMPEYNINKLDTIWCNKKYGLLKFVNDSINFSINNYYRFGKDILREDK